MANVNKIHVNSSTKMSLNDRFTVMSKIDPKSFSNVNQMKVNRNETNINARTNAKSSIANRILLQQLSRKHHVLAALKLKRRSLKPSNRNHSGRGIRRTLIQTRLEAEGRTNIKTNMLTMKAGVRTRSLKRLKFTRNQEVTGRQSKMAHNHPIESIKKLRKRRGSVSGNMSLSKSNVGQQNNRSNSISRQLALPSTNSRVDLNRLRSRSRSNIRMSGLQTSRSSSLKENSRTRRRSVSNSRVSNPGPSIIHRLGVNHNQRSASKRLQNRSRIGQINKRGNSNLTKNNTTQSKFRRGRVSENTADRARGRSRSRTRGRFNTSMKINQNQNKNQYQNQNQSIRSQSRNIRRGRVASKKLQRNSANFETTHRRGRSRARRTNNGSNSSRRGSVKKEDLDKELDQYMANTEN